MDNPSQAPLPLGVPGAIALVAASMLAQLVLLSLLAQSPLAAQISDNARLALADWLGNGLVLIVATQRAGYSLRRLLHRNELRAGPFMLQMLPPLVLLLPGVMALDTALSDLADSLFPNSIWEEQAARFLEAPSLSGLVLAVGIAPLLEELLFRGLILQGFLRRYRPGVALFASALLFGLAHGNVHQFLVAFPLGLANGWLVWRTRSLWPAIALHAMLNGAAVWMTGMDVTAGMWMLPALVVGLAAAAWLHRLVESLPRRR
jgi:membrane protease YdiL (CAAX protease family)